ncbi:MAG: cyclic pyranopterin monophosphate synthase MoaC [Candidatus Hydrothermarchaeales archaeon]
MSLSHVTDKGVKMVEVSGKTEQKRYAKATGRIKLRQKTIELIKKGTVEKGNVLTCAQVAAVMAVKNTPSLIPMCHPLEITGVDVDFTFIGNEIEATVEVKSVGKTGVEMEAITGVSVALLTLWDMVKSAEKDKNGQYPVTEIKNIKVVRKIKE